MAIMVASGKGASAGVLFKNAEAIEMLRKVDTLVVDKTGTLTEGKPTVAAIEPAGIMTREELLFYAASLERGSEHPLAAAIVKAAQSQGLRLAAATDFTYVPGKGLRGSIEGRQVVLGNPAMTSESGIEDGWPWQESQDMLEQGFTLIYVAVDGRGAGLIGITDPIKESTPRAIKKLQEEGIAVVMLTGDNRRTAERVAEKLGIMTVMGEVLPYQKAVLVKQLQEQGHRVAMAGDGINDAPALAQADVGIAMGSGTDVAMESAGVTLVKSNLEGIIRARALSRATMRNIRQNLFFAFIYNALGVPVAAGVLYPFFGILLSPVIAAAAMSLSSVSVIGNALRLRRLRL